MAIRYAVCKDDSDWFPVLFRPDCERTYFDRLGKDMSLVEITEKLSEGGYELRDNPPKKYARL